MQVSPNCNKSMIRKEVLENLVVDVTLKAFTKGTDLNTLAEQLLKKLNIQLNDQSVLKLLESEQVDLQKSLKNMLDAVEKGIITNSTKQRIEELENKLEDISTKILLEKSHTKVLLTPKEVINYIKTALKKEPKILIKMLIREIILYDDHIEIYYKHNDRQKPDEPKTHQAFSFYTDYYKCKIQQYRFGNKTVPVELKIICFL